MVTREVMTAGPGDETDEGLLLGDYRLVQLLAGDERTELYQAEQVSMHRLVVLVRLREQAARDPAVVEQFRADIRAKAAVEHPSIGTVYEAREDGEAVYYTREYLAGASLHELREAGVRLPPPVVAAVLRQVGAAMEHLEANAVPKRPLQPVHIFLGDHEVVRLTNLARATCDRAAPPGHDRLALAEVCRDLLQHGAPGSTRTGMLLNMMADREGLALTWTQVFHTARKLGQDLSEGTKVASQALATGPLSASGRGRRTMLSGLLLVITLVVLIGLFAFLIGRGQDPPMARDLGAMVEIPAGTYLTHEGKSVELPAFRIDAHEVSIAEYAEFLEVLASLPDEKSDDYDHPDQPSAKGDHLPDNWEAMWRVARRGGVLDGQRLDLNYPIVLIDWWDAHAYAAWKGGRLPTQEEWFAAAQETDLSVPERGPVDRLPGDVTPLGVHGLAGNVLEWVRDPVKDPAYPMNPRKPMACGASYLQPRDGVKARHWMRSRDVRRRDLGFRIVQEAGP